VAVAFRGTLGQMRRFAAVFLAPAVPALLAAVIFACGSDASTSSMPATPDSGGLDAPTGDDSGGSTDSGNGGGDAGDASDAGDDGAPPGTCAAYCAKIMASCTGASAQYPSTDACLAACATFPPGTPGNTSGDSLACRATHTGSATPSECANAGPTGGDTRAVDGGGTCGDGCAAFCDLAQTVCTGTNAQFADKATCLSSLGCGFFAPLANPPYSMADTSKNDFGCRMYYLTLAAADSASAVTNCKKIVPGSTVCTN
jgi:hypothetical protein